MDINVLMAELAQYIRIQEEAAATVEALKDQLKAQMQAAGVDTLQGGHLRPKKGFAGRCRPVHKNHGNP